MPKGLRLPLESIVGVSAQGGFLERIRLNVGITGTEVHEFSWGNRIKLGRHEVRGEIEAVLKGSREERKKAAQVAISAGATPSMIFCRFCGARNKNDQMKCGNCGALLK